MRKSAFLLVSCIALLSAGCGRSTPETAPAASVAPRVAATNSYLEAAVLDVLGGQEPVLRLADPGMCPGHFDIRPSQVEDLRRCRLLLRFDFQASLDAKLSNVFDGGLKIREIRVSGGLCEPSSYLGVCRQVADALVAERLADRTAADPRLAAINNRIEARTVWCRDQVAKAGWAGRSVVCSGHQEAFCKWLGLKVAATFSGADSAAIGDIERAIRAGDSAGVGAVIANLPEGRRMADALGQRLNAKVVVFGNFPMLQGDGPPFDELLNSNVRALVGAARQ
jgi:zinc transport system substrate-binding protein